MTTVLFLLDAFRHDYLSEKNTPFLWKSAQKGEHYERVVPSLGFCERSEILSGLKPAETGFFTAIGYDPEDSPFRRFKYMLLLETFFPNAFRRFIKKFSNGMSIYQIPTSLLSFWSLTEDKVDIRSNEALPYETIFSLMKNAGKEYYYSSFTALNLPPNGTDQDRMKMVLNNASDLEYEFFLIYISAPDLLGHEYGPNSYELRHGMHLMDKELKSFTELFIEKRPESNLIFLGDHGMSAVKSNIDVGSELLSFTSNLNMKLKKDFIYFLDSTILRVWFFSKRAKDLFEMALKESHLLSKNGLFLNATLAKELHIPWSDQKYGDLIWLVNEGNLIFPDFFHREKSYKGMHGYDPSLTNSQGTCIVYGSDVDKKTTKTIALTDVFHILKRVLGL